MKPLLPLSGILTAVSLAFPTARDANTVDRDALRDSIKEGELMAKAQTIEAFAYASPRKNRAIGTSGLRHTMEYIWDTLEVLDYYDMKIHWFQLEVRGEPRMSYNIIAQTREGDTDNVLHLGAHMDSARGGPGMNDNASGCIGILEVAIQLARYAVNNAVRFSWWSAAEVGLAGSHSYVEWLPQEELDKIRLYLNLDMIASPAHEFRIYSSNSSGTGLVPPPPGSAGAERLFRGYFEDVAGVECGTVAMPAAGSDHWPFAIAGVPTSGLFAGSDPSHHGPNDTVANMDRRVFTEMTKAIAHAVGTYAVSFDGFPPRAV